MFNKTVKATKKLGQVVLDDAKTITSIAIVAGIQTGVTVLAIGNVPISVASDTMDLAIGIVSSAKKSSKKKLDDILAKHGKKEQETEEFDDDFEEYFTDENEVTE